MRRLGCRYAMMPVILQATEVAPTARIPVRLGRVLLTRRGDGFWRAIVCHAPQRSLNMTGWGSDPNLGESDRRPRGTLGRSCAWVRFLGKRRGRESNKHYARPCNFGHLLSPCRGFKGSRFGNHRAYRLHSPPRARSAPSSPSPRQTWTGADIAPRRCCRPRYSGRALKHK
jgi:hypothetical protein